MTETLHLGRIDSVSGVAQSGRQWTRWDFFDATNNKLGSTFAAAVGNSAQAHIGGLVDLDREHDGQGYKITAVRPSSAQASVTPQQPVSGQGGGSAAQTGYWKPRDPKESRSIIRQTALKAAAQVATNMNLTGAADITGLASHFEVWLTRPLPDDVAVGGQDTEIPF